MVYIVLFTRIEKGIVKVINFFKICLYSGLTPRGSNVTIKVWRGNGPRICDTLGDTAMTAFSESKARDKRWYFLAEEGYTQREIADKEGTSASYVSQRIKKHRDWMSRNKNTVVPELSSLFSIHMRFEVDAVIKKAQDWLGSENTKSSPARQLRELLSIEESYLQKSDRRGEIADLVFELAKEIDAEWNPMKPREWKIDSGVNQ